MTCISWQFHTQSPQSELLTILIMAAMCFQNAYQVPMEVDLDRNFSLYTKIVMYRRLCPYAVYMSYKSTDKDISNVKFSRENKKPLHVPYSQSSRHAFWSQTLEAGLSPSAIKP